MAPRFPEGEVMRLPHAKGSFPREGRLHRVAGAGRFRPNTPATAADQKDM